MDFIGIDIGTSGCKAAVVSENGQFRCIAHRKYSWLHEKPGFVELNPSEVWNAVKEVLKEISSKSVNVKSMAVSSLGEAFVLLDSEDKPLCNSMIYLDKRGNEMLHEISASISMRELHRITGARLNGMYSLPQLLWYKKNVPELINGASKILLISDFINYMLTGECVIDTTLAARSLLFDIKELDWSRVLMDKFGLPVDKFSSVRQSGNLIGKLTKSNASNLGLSNEISVYTGCHDQCGAMLGAGVYETGQMMIGQGSTESMNVMIDHTFMNNPELLLDNQMVFGPYIIPGAYAMYAGILTSGTCIKWYIDKFEKEFKDTCLKDGKDPYELLEKTCVDDSRGAYFLPFLSKIHCRDDEAGALGAFVGLDVSVDKSVLYRAVLEGMCFESRVNLDRLRSAGVSSNKIAITGGCSQSKLLMQIKADVLNLPINTLETPEAGIIGLSMICAVACGICSSYAQAVKQFVNIKNTYKPSKCMDNQYKEYKLMRQSIIGMYENVV